MIPQKSYIYYLFILAHGPKVSSELRITILHKFTKALSKYNIIRKGGQVIWFSYNTGLKYFIIKKNIWDI